MFTQRLIKPELLDHLPPEEARPNLEDLIRINQRFGGHSTILKTIRQVARENESFSLLDIGAASGDTARTIKGAFPNACVVSFDNNAVNLSAAPQPKLIGNAFSLPFAPHSFDFVMCSLFLHHFADESVIALLKSFYSVARKALLICDLERHVLPYIFLPATRLLFGWHEVTVHDGVISVRASFKEAELRKLAARAGITEVQTKVYRPAFRISLVAQKNNGNGT